MTLNGKYGVPTDACAVRLASAWPTRTIACPSRSRSSSITNDVNGYTYDARQNDRTPIISYGFDVANPALYTLTEMRSAVQRLR
ncbi:hypothetical protein ACRAWD_29575 [Caulobacter segnis]